MSRPEVVEPTSSYVSYLFAANGIRLSIVVVGVFVPWKKFGRVEETSPSRVEGYQSWSPLRSIVTEHALTNTALERDRCIERLAATLATPLVRPYIPRSRRHGEVHA